MATTIIEVADGRGHGRRRWSDERGHGGDAPPAVLFRYAPDRKGERPAAHLQSFSGHLHADG